MLNELLLALGAGAWKPILSVLVLPPMPFLLLVLAGAWRLPRRRAQGWALLLLGWAGLWLMAAPASGRLLERWVLDVPPPLSREEIQGLKRNPDTAILVLGGGRKLLAREYGVSDLKPRTLERLRYGIHLARETGLPLGFSGGVGHGAKPGASEAEIAARISEREFGLRLRWQEAESRDTHENALRSVALLRGQGVQRIVLVTHGYHMRRALKNFRAAAAGGAAGAEIRITPAPMGLWPDTPLIAGDWLPSRDAYEDVGLVLHEWLGRLVGS